MKLEIGKKYDVLLKCELRSVTITEGYPEKKSDGERYVFVWDDGDEEWAYYVDIKMLIDKAEEFKQSK